MNTKTIRVLLADDHKMLRDGLRSLLEAEDDMQVVAEAGTVQDTIRISAEVLPDAVVMTYCPF
jgi:DNA-binding NarL/FixJ family response regulator